MADIKNTQKFEKSNQADVLKQVCEDLIETEASIKAGGDQYTTYEKNHHVQIGSVTNTFPAIRKDTQGEFRPKSVNIENKGSFVKNDPVPYLEDVENSRFPCGSYSLNVGNSYDISVGNGGASIATGGNMKLGSGGRSVISSKEEMNVSSAGNVNVRAGSNLNLRGDSVTLQGSNQVVVNTNLGVSKNAVINGCAFVDGELYVNHITCPAEVQYTGGGVGSFGQIMDRGGGGQGIIGYVDLSYIQQLYNSIDVDISGLASGDIVKQGWGLPNYFAVKVLPAGGMSVTNGGGATVAANPQNSIFIYPHEHPFNNVPISFTTGNGKMRDAAASIATAATAGTAKAISHGYKTPGK
jgi:hypothetical protein